MFLSGSCSLSGVLVGSFSKRFGIVCSFVNTREHRYRTSIFEALGAIRRTCSREALFDVGASVWDKFRAVGHTKYGESGPECHHGCFCCSYLWMIFGVGL